MILFGSMSDFRNTTLNINVMITSVVITQEAFAGLEQVWNALYIDGSMIAQTIRILNKITNISLPSTFAGL